MQSESDAPPNGINKCYFMEITKNILFLLANLLQMFNSRRPIAMAVSNVYVYVNCFSMRDPLAVVTERSHTITIYT